MKQPSYARLFGMQLISLIIMFFVMYAMIDVWDHFYFNINKLYMAVLMVAPMIIVMLLFMGLMYPNKRLNFFLIGLSALLFLAVFYLVRTQGLVSNRQFLNSMIPHHSSAILMCREANITDRETQALCEQIIDAQRSEIEQMQNIMKRLND